MQPDDLKKGLKVAQKVPHRSFRMHHMALEQCVDFQKFPGQILVDPPT